MLVFGGHSFIRPPGNVPFLMCNKPLVVGKFTPGRDVVELCRVNQKAQRASISSCRDTVNAYLGPPVVPFCPFWGRVPLLK